MAKLSKVILSVFCTIALAGCASNIPPAHIQNITKLQAASIHSVKCSGEFGYINPARSFSASLNYSYINQQNYTLRLSSLFLLHDLIIQKQGNLFYIQTVNDQHLVTTNLTQFLEQTLHLDIPVNQLNTWLLGEHVNQANTVYYPNGLLKTFTYQQWTIEYPQYSYFLNYSLPKLILVKNKTTTLKILLSTWRINGQHLA